MSDEPRFWLPFTKEQIGYLISCAHDEPGLADILIEALGKIDRHNLLEAHAAKERKERISLDDIELE